MGRGRHVECFGGGIGRVRRRDRRRRRREGVRVVVVEFRRVRPAVPAIGSRPKVENAEAEVSSAGLPGFAGGVVGGGGKSGAARREKERERKRKRGRGACRRSADDWVTGVRPNVEGDEGKSFRVVDGWLAGGVAGGVALKGRPRRIPARAVATGDRKAGSGRGGRGEEFGCGGREARRRDRRRRGFEGADAAVPGDRPADGVAGDWRRKRKVLGVFYQSLKVIGRLDLRRPEVEEEG